MRPACWKSDPWRPITSKRSPSIQLMGASLSSCEDSLKVCANHNELEQFVSEPIILQLPQRCQRSYFRTYRCTGPKERLVALSESPGTICIRIEAVSGLALLSDTLLLIAYHNLQKTTKRSWTMQPPPFSCQRSIQWPCSLVTTTTTAK